VRICLASIHPRILSGQIESLIALRAGLEALGHSVRVVSAFDPQHLRDERRWQGEYGDALALAPKVVRIGRIVGSIASAARDSDVLHFNVPTPSFALLADLVQLATRRPVVVGFEAHLADVPAVAKRLRAAPEFYAPRLLVNNGLVASMTMRRGARYVVSSELQRRELTSLGYQTSRVSIIPNLIDEAKLHHWSRDEARDSLGLPDGPVVAFVGHYHDVKGHDVLIDAFADVLREVPEARLVLAWSGLGKQARMRQSVERAGVASHVIELGRLDVAQLFAAADVVALPYRFTIGQAAYPGTVIEAMWAGVPLVTSDLPLLAELTGGGQTALLAAPGEPHDLARQIVRLLREPVLAASIVEAQRRAMAARFNPQQLVQEYVEIYEHAVTRQASLLQPARR
jgi:glycosyltransferase involved in cell wall biosynthesis